MFDQFTNLYELSKTLRFELKPSQEKENVNFEQSEKFMNDNFLKYGEEIDTKEGINKKIKVRLEILFLFFQTFQINFSKFLSQMEKKNIPFSGIEVTAQLMEHLDSQQFYRHKKGCNKTKFVPLHHLKGDNFLNWFFDGIKKKIAEIQKFEILIKNHQLYTQSNFIEMQSAVRWYADIESFAKRIEEFVTLLNYMRFPEIDIQESENWNDEQRNTWKNCVDSLSAIFEDANKEKLKTEIKELLNFIKENAFVECGMLSMNEKGLNKNPQKIKKMEEWLENIKEEQATKLGQIRKLDEERKLLLDGDRTKGTLGLYKLLDEESKKWVQNGMEQCPEFAIHLLKDKKYNQDLHDKKQKLAELRKTPHHKRTQEFYNVRDEVNKLKVEKGLIQDRKRLFLENGILSFKCSKDVVRVLEDLKKELNPSKKAKLLNFQYVWEGKFKNPKNSNEIQFFQIEDSPHNKKDLTISSELEQNYKKNISLINQKRNLSKQYGDNKSFINSLQREIERQGKIEYQAVITRDKEFYYLAFLERENRKDLWKKYFGKIENSEFQALNYERLTFKALEKLALIENATFKEFDELADIELAEQLREIYEKVYKEKQFLEYKLLVQEKKDLQFDKIKMQNFAKKQHNELKNGVIKILLKVIEKLGYSFSPKSDYATLDDFMSDINLQCYKAEWIGIDWKKLLEAEKNGEVPIFKIHNKDFSRAKRTYKNKKNDLFTEYWLDMFENKNSNIRILPEIDLFKKRKEKTIEEVGKIKTKRNSIELLKQGNRFCEDKLYATFRLVFYPEKKSPTVEEFNEKLKNTEEKYFLGLDRGENELLTYCLIDKNKKIAIDKTTQKPILGDWNLDENGFDYAKKLKEFSDERKKLLEKSILLQDSDDEDEKKRIYEELEKIHILESETVKKGIRGHVLEQINEIMTQYPNTFIVLEDLDKKNDQSGDTNKEANLEKTFGGTAYQVVEDAIISKFKYYQTKNNEFQGVQFVPNIERIRDLREVKDENELERNKFGRIRFVKSKEQIGRVLFVDEFLTSQMCPECGFCITEDKKRTLKNGGCSISKKDLKDKIGNIGKDIDIRKFCFKNNDYELKHLKYFTENSYKINNDNITDFFVPRIKVHFYKILNELEIKEENQTFIDSIFIENDPFFCPSCGKNTEEKNFIEPFESGDDIAAYNIAKRGLEFLNKFVQK